MEFPVMIQEEKCFIFGSQATLMAYIPLFADVFQVAVQIKSY